MYYSEAGSEIALSSCTRNYKCDRYLMYCHIALPPSRANTERCYLIRQAPGRTVLLMTRFEFSSCGKIRFIPSDACPPFSTCYNKPCTVSHSSKDLTRNHHNGYTYTMTRIVTLLGSLDEDCGNPPPVVCLSPPQYSGCEFMLNARDADLRLM